MVANPDTVLTVAAIHMISGIGYVILCGIVETEMDAFIRNPTGMRSTNFIMIAILSIEYFHHVLPSKYSLNIESLEMFNY